MKFSEINNMTLMTRRSLMAAGAAAVVFPQPGFALSAPAAQELVTRLIADVNTVISSGKSEAGMTVDFGKVLDRHADVPKIARYCLGADAWAASASQMTAYAPAFANYIATKYGRRFREFIGGEIKVQGARSIKSWIEVETTVLLRGRSPLRKDWHVSDRSGRHLFFNFIIEGVNMLLTERAEVGAMLDRQRGDLDKLIAEMRAV
jgi:phospholipid transport system substrate-binding protein